MCQPTLEEKSSFLATVLLEQNEVSPQVGTEHLADNSALLVWAREIFKE